MFGDLVIRVELLVLWVLQTRTHLEPETQAAFGVSHVGA